MLLAGGEYALRQEDRDQPLEAVFLWIASATFPVLETAAVDADQGGKFSLS